MTPDHAARYDALVARDPRFDGIFYVGVTSTGIYCRPVCTARTPRASNCRFFDSAAAAEKAGFRPCLRCRPELAPGNAPVDDAGRIASLMVQRLEEGMLDAPAQDAGRGPEGLELLAARFGWSPRQLRRMVRTALGVSPMELVTTRRLLLAKRLLTDTALPIGQVALASGFSSLRRFNDAFAARYRMPPSRFRKQAAGAADQIAAADTFTLQLAYRPPFDWPSLVGFLRGRALRGVEEAEGEEYLRTVRLGEHVGWVRVSHAPESRSLRVELPHALTPVLPALLGRLKHLFDLCARPDVIDAQLARDPLLAGSVARTPGLRVPGAFDGFEMAVRAVLGQQVSVRSATTLAGRFAQAFGERVVTPHHSLALLTPTASRLAAATEEEVASLGIVRARARSILALAGEMAAGRLRLEPGADPGDAVARLVALPGIGPWTAQYIAMRALRWPDAFPREDGAMLKRLGGVTPARAEAMSEGWRPWRSYAMLHLWQADPPAPDGGAARDAPHTKRRTE